MKKFSLITSIIMTITLLINVCVYYILGLNNVIVINSMVPLYSLGVLVCSWLPFIVVKIFKIKLTNLCIILYDVFIFFSIILGSIWDAYEFIFLFDKILHAYSGVVIVVIAYILYKNSSSKNNLSLIWLFVLMFSVSLGGGLLWEAYEFVADLLLNLDCQHTGSLVGQAAIMDTMLDIICDIVGALIGAIIIVFSEKKNIKNSDSIKF